MRHADMEGGFLRLVSISNQTCDEIDQEVGDTAVARVFDLGDIFELVIHSFDVTVANSKIDPLPPQVGVKYPAILEGEIQKGRRSGCRPAPQSPPLSESNTARPLGDLRTASGRDSLLTGDRSDRCWHAHAATQWTAPERG